MPNSALDNAIAIRNKMAEKINEAQNSIEEWKRQKARAERFIADWAEFSGEEAPVSAAPHPVPEDGPPPSPRPKNPPKEQVAEACRELVEEAGKPLTRDELIAALPRKDINIEGKRPQVVLQTMLWRTRDRIIHLKGHGYWPPEKAWPAADHNPDGASETEDEGDGEPSFEDIL